MPPRCSASLLRSPHPWGEPLCPPGQAKDRGRTQQDLDRDPARPLLISEGSFEATPQFWSSRVAEEIGRKPHSGIWGLDWI